MAKASKLSERMLGLILNRDFSCIIDTLSSLRGRKKPQDLMPILGGLLKHRRKKVVSLACQNLKDYGPSGSEYAPLLLKAAEKGNYHALEAFLRVSKNYAIAISPAKKFLQLFPEETCDLLYETGFVSEEIVPDLIEIIETGDGDEAWAATDLLGHMGKAAAPAVSLLRALIGSRNTIVAARAGSALRRLRV